MLIRSLYKTYHLPVHIRLHCVKVAAVSIYMAQKITQATKIQIDRVSLRDAALLHDLFKITDTVTTHAEAGFQLLNSLDRPKIARLIQSHDFLAVLNPDIAPGTLEEKILYYADKRVCHDGIVSLTERLAEGTTRYTTEKSPSKDAQRAFKMCFDLENQLCHQARITPEEINEKNLSSISENLIKKYLN